MVVLIKVVLVETYTTGAVIFSDSTIVCFGWQGSLRFDWYRSWAELLGVLKGFSGCAKLRHCAEGAMGGASGLVAGSDWRRSWQEFCYHLTHTIVESDL
jgi:hypothetical protein